jgi:hypothetical protein
VRSKALKWGESSEVLLREDWIEEDELNPRFVRSESVDAVTARGANHKREETLERVDPFTSEFGPAGENPKGGTGMK